MGCNLKIWYLFDDVLAPALVPVVAFRARFTIASEGAYQFSDAVKFVVESVSRGLLVFDLECP